MKTRKVYDVLYLLSLRPAQSLKNLQYKFSITDRLAVAETRSTKLTMITSKKKQLRV